MVVLKNTSSYALRKKASFIWKIAVIFFLSKGNLKTKDAKLLAKAPQTHTVAQNSELFT